jgi:hypothetical protein
LKAKNTAAELRAGHAEDVMKDTQERDVAVDIGGAVYPIAFDREGHGRLLAGNSL